IHFEAVQRLRLEIKGDSLSAPGGTVRITADLPKDSIHLKRGSNRSGHWGCRHASMLDNATHLVGASESKLLLDLIRHKTLQTPPHMRIQSPYPPGVVADASRNPGLSHPQCRPIEQPSRKPAIHCTDDGVDAFEHAIAQFPGTIQCIASNIHIC